MKKLSLRFIVAAFTGNNDRRKAIKIFFLAFFLCCFNVIGYSQVSITDATNGTLICGNKAVGGSAAGFTTLGNIIITENATGDFAGAGGPLNDVLVLNAPPGWQFNTTLPTINFVTGANVSAISGVITSTTLTINLTVNGVTAGDQFTIVGLQVQATSAGAPAGSIYASSVSGINGIVAGAGVTNFGNLSVNPLVTPSVSISGSAGSVICAGTTNVFTPTTIGGGTPSYTWWLNGTPVASGSSYINSTLATGSSIMCTMNSTATCITTNTASSNTITMTVNPVPSAILGSVSICPGGSGNLSDATPFGAWSSGHPAIATVNSSGKVFGVSAGNAVISYTVSGCAATTLAAINNIPAPPVITPSVTAMCNGSIIPLTASGVSTPPSVVSQNLNSTLAPWTVDNTGSVATLPESAWKQCVDGFSNSLGVYHSPDNSGFAMANADASPSTSITSTQLISPTFSLVGYASASLTFQHAYEKWPADVAVQVDISTTGGSSWTTLNSYLGTNVGNRTNFVSEAFSLNPYIGMSNLKIRFYYKSNWGYYWVLENILVSGASAGVVPTWSPITYLYTDAAASVPYAGSQTNTIYLKPTGITTATQLTYTASATNAGCSTIGTNTVTINPSPSAISGSANLCIGRVSVLSNAVPGGTWSSSNTTVATIVAATGATSGLAIGNTNITYTLPGGCYAVTIVTVLPAPSAITGNKSVCAGSSTNLSATPIGGSWSSGGLGVATVVSGTGLTYGSSPGNAPITYTLSAGCISVTTVTVNPVPSAIIGAATSVCSGSTITFSNAVGGGTWSTSNSGVATINTTTGELSGTAGGSVNVTYTLAGNCYVLQPVTVYQMPGPITGITNVCQGMSTMLSNAVNGGVWTSDNLPVATVGAGTSAVYGAGAGMANITYTVGTSCIATTTLTVNPLPSAITGTNVVCSGSSIALTDGTIGGTWSSNNSTVASVDPLGLVTGGSSGVANITYTLATGCVATKAITINPLPATIMGINTVCIGMTTSFSSATGGGTWSSSNASIATVVPGSGLISGLSSGVAQITYSLNTGCFVTRSVTVNSLPSAISGASMVCVGLTTTLSNSVPGGSWTSGNAFASISGSSGAVTGITAGVASITYTLGTSCMVSTTLQVNPLSPVTGIPNVCEGLTTTLSNATPGGTWSSSNLPSATVTLNTGIVGGILAGNTIISYMLPTGCMATTTVVVNPIPNAIGGNTNVCLGSTTTLSDAGAGTWSSASPTIALVDVNSGIVSGVALGNARITYSLSAGCIATTTVVVNPLPANIAGYSTVCEGATIALTDVTTGGTWSSSNTAFATVNTVGLVSGISAGPVVITYTLPTGCITTKNISVNPLPSPIFGSSAVCVGAAILLGNATGSGTWSSSNSAIATVSSVSGILTGASPGTVTISFGVSTGCSIATSVVVNPLPVAITGAASVCLGLTTYLSDVTPGGVWSCNNTAIATVNNNGLVSTVASGAAVITYTLGTGCSATKPLVVNAPPNDIIGNTTICSGGNTVLANAGGGTWSSSNPAVASIVINTGLVTGGTAGTVTITYTLGTGCIATTSLLVNPLPATITGNAGVCLGLSTTLSSTSAGGTWSSSNTLIATVTPTGSGIVNSVAAGTTSIVYMLPTGCSTMKMVTVNPLPNPITGSNAVCIGLSIPLFNTGGGTWSSSNSSVATVVAATGVVTGATAGNTTITYSLNTGCISASTITVNALPPAIVGSGSICHTQLVSLSNSSTGGTWSSSAPAIASVDPSLGTVLGITPGSATITYTLGTGCVATKPLTVNALPANIVGQLNACVLATVTMSDATPGGTWSTTNTGIATIGASSGVLTAVSSGTVTVVYSLSSGCTATRNVNINPLPPSITGNTSICFGASTILSNISVGGTWSSNNTIVAQVNAATGEVYGLSTGIATITYTVDTGCTATAPVTVNPLPGPITGSANICVGQGTTFSNTSSGGTWTSTNTAIATIGASGGIVTGVAAGVAIISYTLPTGCGNARGITVNSSPSAISGITGICIGGTTTLSNAVGGGTWSSSNTSIALPNLTSGVVGGLLPGSASLSYILPGNCAATTLVTVNSLPNSIQGSTILCTGVSIQLSSTTPGGAWSSSNTNLATVSASGLVYGVSTGTVVISYALGTGCSATKTIGVFASPGAISGSANICVGTVTPLSNTASGGIWTSSNTSAAMVDPSSGDVYGIASGGATISYTLGGTCAAVAPVTVFASPSSISGYPVTCIGLTTTLGNSVPGGTWSSSNTSIATVVAGSGLVRGVAQGTTIISYKLPGGCMATTSVTINPPPTPISGTLNTCIGQVTSLSNSVSGGTWSSSNTFIARVGSATGMLVALSPGTATITYAIVSGCSISALVTVNTLPSGIIGSTSMCIGGTLHLSDATASGVWSSSNTSVATVSGTGVVSGITPGTSSILYTLSTGCSATRNITVNALPTAISGPTNICLGSPSPLSNGTAGGAWSSSNTTIATVDPVTGYVTGALPGNVVITYSFGAGCSATIAVSVISAPAPIVGATALCIGQSTALASTTGGGVWSSSNTNVATVFSTVGAVFTVAPGSSVISYSIGTGCVATVTLVVNSLPTPVTGANSVCVGSTIQLSNGTTGGTWSSPNTTNVIVAGTSGFVTGLSPGTANITYTLAAGCIAYKSISVDPLPAAITGNAIVCVGTTAQLSSTSSGGMWSSGNTTIADIVFNSGLVTGITTGNTDITYTLPTGCAINRSITVSPLPSAIGGVTSVCAGANTVLSNSVAGGIWTSGNTSVFAIGASSGVVAGLSAGTADVSYTIGAGCVATASVTVIALPPVIVGTSSVCVGTTTMLSNTEAPGTWSAVTPTVATIDAATGYVVGISPGNTTISFTAGTGCSTATTVTVNPPPAAISGPSGVCVGATITLSNAGGGLWSSNNTNIFTINASSGVITGISAGTTEVTYTLATGCIATRSVTVLPLPPAITGNASICAGYTTQLSNSVAGGTWSTSFAPIVTVGLNTGLVTAGMAGNAVITYRLNTGCAIGIAVIVSPLPSAITGPSSVCEGATITLSNTGAGTWSSSDPTVASLLSTSTGAVAGIDAGLATITYSLGTGCTAIRTITVNPLPSAITGNTTLCAGTSSLLSNASPGGTWSSGTTTIATITTGGYVSGVAAGNSVVTYRLTTGCATNTTVVVNPLPAAISGVSNVCVGSVTTLSNIGGGTWTSSNSAIAAINVSSGVVAGISAGNARITYTIGTGCVAVTTITVNPLPAAITGSAAVCVGSSIGLTDASPGGTWASSSLAVLVGMSSGTITGLGSGAAAITYTLGTGCTTTTTVTVNALPTAITGPAGVCIGSTVTLSNTSGGTWASSNPAVAAIGISSGVVSGLALGTSRITYTIGTGCFTTATITVNPLPGSITGITDICIGLTTDLSDAGGGTWSSGNAGVATVVTATGIVTGVTSGTALITYTLPTGCITSRSVTVRPVPTAIAGITSICTGTSTMLSESVTGGTWVSSNPVIATIGPVTGLVAGNIPGTVTITYLLGAGCSASTSFVVQTTPAAISGSAAVCVGFTTQLSDAPAGGTWTSSNPLLASVDAVTGLVSGISPGSVVISYSLGTGCAVGRTQVINPVASLSGVSLICAGESTTFSSSMAGGVWSSATPPVATVNTAGVVYGASGGTANIIYTLPTGCAATLPVSVNPAAPITGNTLICAGNFTTLANAVPGGTWSSSDPSVATISNTGLVHGLLVGSSVIRYSLPTGCIVSATLSVDPVPGAIVGNPNVCVGATTYLTDAPGGGTWSYTAPSGILGIGYNSGAITGLVVGSQPVTYTSLSGCTAVTTVTVHAPPSSISGPLGICQGASALFTCGTPSGVWSTGNTAVATIVSGSGVLSGVASGSSMITYTTAVGCMAVRPVTINPIPLPITGVTDICAGGSISYVSDATPGGVWTSIMVTVSPTGLVTGAFAGTAVITYTLPTGCATTTVLNVNPLPLTISGTMNACVGASSLLSDATSGGVWSTATTAIAMINPVSGLVTGLAAGTAVISYSNASGCMVTALFTVNPLPPAIIGASAVCEGSSITLSNSITGGVWTSGAPAIASVGGSSGVVSGIVSGTAAITYTSPAGCRIAKPVMVNPLPVGVTGANYVCIGGTSLLSDFPAGGTWSSAAPSIATVGLTTGLVTGVSASVTTLTYTLGTGCIRTVPFTVNPLPPAITGATHVCLGDVIPLSNTNGSGVWSAANPAIATVGYNTGLVTGVGAGTVAISYTLPTGCATTRSVIVNPAPPPFNMTGGGVYCASDSGRHIGLAGSAIGFTYRLYRGAAMVSSFLGTGASIDFGLQTVAGIYTVRSTNNTSGCNILMPGSISISVTPLAVPTAAIIPPSGAVCGGDMASYSASATNVGTLVTCKWLVNGVYMATANPYTYVPSGGDVLTCIVSGNATCVTSPSVSAVYTVTLTPKQTPLVSIAPFPNDTVCAGTSVSYSPVAVFGGLSPAYQWLVNGLPASTAMIFSYTPANADVVSCVMTSSHGCVTVDTALSNLVTMTIVPYSSPSVTITADPSITVGPGESITFTASAAGAGPSPSYQWYINQNPVPGATSSVYTGSNFNNQDSVTCVIISNGMCSNYAWAYLVVTIQNVGISQVGNSLSDISLLPNPNSGIFTIKGTLPADFSDKELSLHVTNILGQVVYKMIITPHNGKIDQRIELAKNLANGMYLLDLRASGVGRIFHFVVEQ